MRFLSATDVALAQALRAGNLIVRTRTGRTGDYITLSDEVGLIEVHNTQAEADARLAAIQKALGA